MNKRLNGESSIFTLSAVVVGFLLIPELSAKQQNDLGNWLMLVGQVLCTNAAHLAILTPSNTSSQDMSHMLEKTVSALQKEIEELKNKTT